MSQDNPDPNWSSALVVPPRGKYTRGGTAKSVSRKTGGNASGGQKARAKARGHRGGQEAPETVYARQQRHAAEADARQQTPRRFSRRFRGGR